MKAEYLDLPEDKYFSMTSKTTPAGYNDHHSQPGEDAPISWRENFTGFWRVWRADIIKRDYEVLDKIHPGRMGLEAWLRATGYSGKRATVLKNIEDGKSRPFNFLMIGWTLLKGMIAYYLGGVEGFKKSIVNQEGQSVQ